MKKVLNLILCVVLVAGPLFGAEGGYPGVFLISPEDYRALLPDDLPEPEPEISRAAIMGYSEEFWRNAVRNVDGDSPLEMELPPAIDKLRPSFALPLYETEVSLTGKKTFGIKADGKKYKQDNANSYSKRSYSNFLFEQSLQVKMEGKIADRIFADIEYDDQAPESQLINISYRGKGKELVQSMDFGDIELSLPSTEFISFNKQIFGAKMHLQHGGANLRLIGSRTKGSGKTKQFQGNSVFEKISIPDRNYIRRTYYDVTALAESPSALYDFLRVSIARNTEEVYLDDHSATSNNQHVLYPKAYSDLSDDDAPSKIFQANFRLLQRGVDYTVDYTSNKIIFRSARSETDTVIIDYINVNGERLSDKGNAVGTLKLLKTEGDVNSPYNNQVTDRDRCITGEPCAPRAEMKTFYNTGRQQITRDDGKGSFSLILLDANGKNISSDEGQVYPTSIIMDFDTGIFQLLNRFPYQELYQNTPTSYKNMTFEVEVFSKFKTYYIEPGMVVNSESVSIDGLTLKRSEDYYIDYNSGFITFYKENLINQNSIITVNYDTSTGSQSNSTLLGARLDYEFTDKVSVGGTVLSESGDSPDRAPFVSSTTQSTEVYEADFKAKDVNITDKLKVSASAEVAQSVKNRNLYGYAIVDNMEDVKQRNGISTSLLDWTVASNPLGAAAYYGGVLWDTEEVRSIDINKNSSSSSSDKQPVLVINYDFTKSSVDGEVSIVYPISNTGIDLSDKNMLELVAVAAEGSADPLLNIHFGQIDERSDHSNRVPSSDPDVYFSLPCSAYYPSAIPKTEDLQCRGNISSSEDSGWVYLNPNGSKARYNPFADNKFYRETQPNGRTDTQDLDGNGRLDDADASKGGSFGYAWNNPLVVNSASGAAELEWNDDATNRSDWRTYQNKLELDTEDKRARWTAVKHIRITLKKRPGLAANEGNTGTIKIAELSLSGNIWNAKPENEQFLVTAKNKIDNTDYFPIYSDTEGDGYGVFRDLYGSLDELRSESRNQNVFEQALSFYYNTKAAPPAEIAPAAVYAQRNFSNMDFSSHKELRFLLSVPKGEDDDSVFFMRLGTEDNYLQVNVPLNLPGFENKKWKLITLSMDDPSGTGAGELYAVTPGVEVVKSVPYTQINFRKISMVGAGVMRLDMPGVIGIEDGEVLFNELHLARGVTVRDTAYRGEGKISYAGWGEAGGTYRYKGSQFETPTSVSTDQENTKQNYWLNVTRIKDVPVSLGYSQDETVTPVGLDNANTNTIRRLDDGKVTVSKGFAKVDVAKPGKPKVAVEYNFANTDYDLIQREDKKNYYSASIRHSMSKGAVKEYSAGVSHTNTTIDYSAAQINNLNTSYFNTEERTNALNSRVTLAPWKGFSFTPSYSLSMTREDKTGRGVDASNYPKAMTQNAGVVGSLKVADWLVPTFSYNIRTAENNNLTPTAVSYGSLPVRTFDIGEIKSVNRSANGSLGLNINIKEIFPKSKLFSTLSLSNTYRLQDADSWLNVEEGYDTKNMLWVRDTLNPSSPYAYRRSLSALDTYTSSQRWLPFKEYGLKGAMEPFGTFSVLNNFTYSKSATDDLGTETDSTSLTLPDVVFSISDIEKFWGNSFWLNSTDVKLRLTQIENEVKGTSIKDETRTRLDFKFLFVNRFDTLLTYVLSKTNTKDLRADETVGDTFSEEISAQSAFNIKKLRITPKVSYKSSETVNRGAVTEKVSTLAPAINARLDINLPGGIWLPFVNRNYSTTNRIIWNTNLVYNRVRSELVVLENKDVWDLNTSFDYEISQNFRITVTGALQWQDSLYVETESYFGYNFGTVLTIQF